MITVMLLYCRRLDVSGVSRCDFGRGVFEVSVVQLLEALRCDPEGRGFDSRPHCGPGVESASNRNECQGDFLGGRGGAVKTAGVWG